ncbi:helix-turn-helix domain-containing protein [Furfurilactobacillus milii]|uniref:Helix-turn-helix domain-containing protein n=1 Tax=Furfurilactobacillus milii TaxID=2888272 RepID=A0A6N9I508_9LACO|nr:helix-turn-helix transcriptional regulator [Furfurilactobacillus milii]MYV18060.1 helix-turn-helix domain-containing protein [Furfurilactobacillus milii]
MNENQVRDKIKELRKEFEKSLPSSAEYTRVSKKLDDLYYEHMDVREAALIAKHLDHKDTIDDDAKMIVAATNGENVAEAMGLPINVCAAFKILHERLAKGWTQAELGQKVNLSQSQIAKIENIQQIPDVGTLSGILVALDTQMEIGARKIS